MNQKKKVIADIALKYQVLINNTQFNIIVNHITRNPKPKRSPKATP